MSVRFDISNQQSIDAASVSFASEFLGQLADVKADPLSQLFNEKTTNKKVSIISMLLDMPGFREWNGDRILADVGALQQSVLSRSWSSGFALSEDQLNDDALGQFPEAIGWMAELAVNHRYDLMMEVMLNGFDGLAFPRAGTRDAKRP